MLGGCFCGFAFGFGFSPLGPEAAGFPERVDTVLPGVVVTPSCGRGVVVVVVVVVVDKAEAGVSAVGILSEGEFVVAVVILLCCFSKQNRSFKMLAFCTDQRTIMFMLWEPYIARYVASNSSSTLYIDS